jgi:hypothetical protein
MTYVFYLPKHMRAYFTLASSGYKIELKYVDKNTLFHGAAFA